MELATGETRRLFDTLEVLEGHPQKGGNFNPDNLFFKHTKWSYDGKHFMFVFTNGSWPPPEDEDRVFSVMLADADGSNVRHLTDKLGHPFWHPESSSVWGVRIPPDLWSPEWYLVSNPLNGDPETRIHMDLFGNHALINPDGKFVAADVMHGPPETGTGMFLMDLETEEWRWLARFDIPDMAIHPHPAWSRDGRRVYFNVLEEEDQPALYVVDVG
jgi:Tol biopolymer transport system component